MARLVYAGTLFAAAGERTLAISHFREAVTRLKPIIWSSEDYEIACSVAHAAFKIDSDHQSVESAAFRNDPLV
jgi:hypothetical protein